MKSRESTYQLNQSTRQMSISEYFIGFSCICVISGCQHLSNQAKNLDEYDFDTRQMFKKTRNCQLFTRRFLVQGLECCLVTPEVDGSSPGGGGHFVNFFFVTSVESGLE